LSRKVAGIGYTVSGIIPMVIIGCVGPYMRRNLPMAFTFFEYIQARYGALVNAYCTLISLFFMLLIMSATYTSVGSCVVLFSELTSPLGPVIATSIVTVVYTSIGGLPISFFTDKVQGVFIIFLTAVICVAAFTFYELPTSTNDKAVIGN
jgi:Na+/proline symporter